MMFTPFRLVCLLTVVLSAFILMHYLQGMQHQMGETLHKMEAVQQEVISARDSLYSTRQTLLEMMEQMRQAQSELQIIRSQVEVVDMKYEQNKSDNGRKLQQLRQELQQKEKALLSLKEEAMKFEY